MDVGGHEGPANGQGGATNTTGYNKASAGSTGWLFLIEYGSELKGAGTSNRKRADYRAILSEQEYVLFDRLRRLRKETAEQQGVPVYAIFTNEHLAAMVKRPSENEKALLDLPNVGEARLDSNWKGARFGERSVRIRPVR